MVNVNHVASPLPQWFRGSSGFLAPCMDDWDTKLTMPRLCLRRKRTLLIGCFLFFIGASLLVLTGNMRQNYALDIPSDYDLSYDPGDIGNELVRQMSGRRKSLAGREKVLRNLHVDRKPKAHNLAAVPDNSEEAEQYKDEEGAGQMPIKKYSFLRQEEQNVAKFDQGKSFQDNHDEGEDDYTADDDNDDDKNIENLIIEDETAEEEEEEDEEYTEYEYWNNDNPEFAPGDFDEEKNSTKGKNNIEDTSPNKTGTNRNVLQSQHQFRKSPNSQHRNVKPHSKGHGRGPLKVPQNVYPGAKRTDTFHSLKARSKQNSDQNLVQKFDQNNPVGKATTTNRTVPIPEQPATQLQMPELSWRQGEVYSKAGFPVVRDRIYWSEEVEKFVPKGISDEDIHEFIAGIRSHPVKEMHPAVWNRCGRPKNQFIVLSDGTPLCARYRHPHMKLVQGEVLSFYLSRLLGLDNVPIVVLSEVNSSTPQWQGQSSYIKAAEWDPGQLVAFIQWVEGLDSERSRVKMPSVILSAYETGMPVDRGNLALVTMTPEELSELVQWSDLILFDYVSGHYDRVASMQDGAEQENKPSIMSESIRNLRKIWQHGKLWFIDNESGLLDAYELLYQGKHMGKKFIQFHLKILRTMCVFRKSVVEKIERLVAQPHPEETLENLTRAMDPLYKTIPQTAQYILFKNFFRSRLKEVFTWVQDCKSR